MPAVTNTYGAHSAKQRKLRGAGAAHAVYGSGRREFFFFFFSPASKSRRSVNSRTPTSSGRDTPPSDVRRTAQSASSNSIGKAGAMTRGFADIPEYHCGVKRNPGYCETTDETFFLVPKGVFFGLKPSRRCTLWTNQQQTVPLLAEGNKNGSGTVWVHFWTTRPDRESLRRGCRRSAQCTQEMGHPVV